MNFKGQKVLVVGLGLSGFEAARLLQRRGARVVVTDQQPKKKLESKLRALSSRVTFLPENRIQPKDFNLVVTSPGIPSTNKVISRALKNKIPVWSELELGWRCVKPYRTAAITGTNGKTTTTALLGHILKKSGRPTVVAGNIGTPLSAVAARISSKAFVVLEVSSYQLEFTKTFHPNVGVLLNITPDHLARHGTLSKYAQAKARLFQNFVSSDTAVLNRNDSRARKIGRGIRGRKIWFPSNPLAKFAASIRLPGVHNQENAMAAGAAARALGVGDRHIISGLKSFHGVPHRIQFVRTVRGMTFLNDSKATNVDSTLVALKACEKPIILILGGEHKGSPYRPLIPLLKKKVSQVLTIGEAAPKIVHDLKGKVSLVSCQNMKNAVAWASKNGRKGNTVLLSPACASFDQYNNYEERGEHFMRLVKGLPS